jgi:Tfp pilus assembly protein PilO
MTKVDLRIVFNKYRYLAFPAVVGLIILILTVIILIPSIKQIIQKRQALTQEKETLAKLTQKVADLEGLDPIELANKTDVVVKSLPAEKDVPRILATLSILATESGVMIESVKVAPGALSTVSGQEKAKEKPALSFEISIKGAMVAIRDFLDRISSTVPVMQINEAFLSGDEEERRAEVSFDAYFLPLPKTLGLPENPLAKITSDEEIAYKKIERFYFPLAAEILPSVGSGKENLFSF